MRPTGLMPPNHTLRPGRAAHHAFTLIELMVVMAIIAVLAAILFPVFASARRSARRTICVSNLHQSGIAFNLYQQDYDGRFPAAPAAILDGLHYLQLHDGFTEGAIPGQISWTELVLPYVKTVPATGQSQGAYRPTSPLFFCPDDSNPPARLGLVQASEGTPSTSYAYKMWIASSRSETEVPELSRMAMIWEQKDFHKGGVNNDFARASEMNVLYTDGHVRWKRLSEATTSILDYSLDGKGTNLNVLFPCTPLGCDHYGQDFMN